MIVVIVVPATSVSIITARPIWDCDPTVERQYFEITDNLSRPSNSPDAISRAVTACVLICGSNVVAAVTAVCSEAVVHREDCPARMITADSISLLAVCTLAGAHQICSCMLPLATEG